MVRIIIEGALWRTARSHLDQGAEEVGFFLADWSPAELAFVVRDWRPIRDETTVVGREMHVSLSDETRASVIRWASAEEGCLIEAHSHGRGSPAAFSPFDLRGLAEWVPHLWWRLRGRPYAALVTSTADFDALAWVEDPRLPKQVAGVTADRFVPATRATLEARGAGGADG